MIAWPIAAALASDCFAHVLVSTDDEEIAEVARQYDAEVPFLRPAELAGDFTHAHIAAKHALEWAIVHWGPVEHFCHLYPGSPFLSAEKIQEGLILVEQGAPNAYSMQRVPFPVFQILVRNASNELSPLFSHDKANMRSQDMPEAFVDAGQMYWFQTAYFLANETTISSKTGVVELPRESCIDIDTFEDWSFAEKMAAALKK